jgi:hypothetical protein
MKKVLLSVATLAVAGGLSAQTSRFSLGAELAFPTGDWSDFIGMGFGGTLGFEMPVGDHLGLIAQAGYLRFAGKDVDFGGITIESDGSGVAPIQVGAKYYFTDNQEGAYLGLLTGLHMVASEVAQADGTTDTETDSNFGVAPMVGYFLGEHIDLAVRYQLLFAEGLDDNFQETTVTNGYIGIRAAYTFGSR